ncbi:MAG: 6-hydroxymethylpterin diphosphokinase MptE-like protein [Candidatus Thermoplasmatota archaeon]|nr:6-hydroxymethylpterin diphosphokinase MptE-like protein [Candidatus Thermoplasmatota archaeon]
MEISKWLPIYNEISRDLDLDPKKDATAGRMLADLMAKNGRIDDPEEVVLELERIIFNRDVYVLGAGPDLESEISLLISQKIASGSWIEGSSGNDVIIAADGATSTILANDMVPQVIVTDLDGGLEDQLSCLSRGSVMVLHSHGDNMNQLMSMVPRLHGSVLGTTQVSPFDAGGLYNFGGFTDGDRSAFLADHFGSLNIILLGFDFTEVGHKLKDGGVRIPVLSPQEERFKFKKLAWANILLGTIGPPEVRFYSDRTPY